MNASPGVGWNQLNFLAWEFTGLDIHVYRCVSLAAIRSSDWRVLWRDRKTSGPCVSAGISLSTSRFCRNLNLNGAGAVVVFAGCTAAESSLRFSVFVMKQSFWEGLIRGWIRVRGLTVFAYQVWPEDCLSQDYVSICLMPPQCSPRL